jgi:hypothetical protein
MKAAAVKLANALVVVIWLTGCGGGSSSSSSSSGGGGAKCSSSSGGQPTVTLNPPAAGSAQLSGMVCNADNSADKIVIYALTNEWYVQPLTDAPFTDIAANGTWESSTNPWSSLVILLVNPANYTTPAATSITNPALDQGVLAWTAYPAGPVSLNFSGYTWGIKTTGNSSGDQFDPGPNFWSNDSSVVYTAADGLHLKINRINGAWQCGEVYLTQSLGYGTYKARVSSDLSHLDLSTVAAPLFIYASPVQELDSEFSGLGGLVARPYNAEFVVQPYTVSGNIAYYTQPSTAQFTIQMEWQADHVAFTTWNGWTDAPAAADIIYQWTYAGSYIPPPGQERVHMNLWLLNGTAPTSGTGDQIVINAFTFQPATAMPTFSPAGGTYTSPQTVTISDATAGASIYYTTDGTIPTVSSPVYVGPITVASTETIEAFATLAGHSPSAVASATYTIGTVSPGFGIQSVSAILPEQTQTVTIVGSGFGSLPAYNGNSSYINLVDNSGTTWSAGFGTDLVGLAITSWTDTQIVLGGFTGAYGAFGWNLNSGDNLTLSISNPESGSGPYTCTGIIVGAGPTNCPNLSSIVKPNIAH